MLSLCLIFKEDEEILIWQRKCSEMAKMKGKFRRVQVENRINEWGMK